MLFWEALAKLNQNMSKAIALLFVVLLNACALNYQSSEEVAPLTMEQLVEQIPQLKGNLESALTTISREAKSAEEIEFRPLTGGMTSAALFIFELRGKRFVLRTLKTHPPLKERQNEIKAHKFAASIGIAPKLVYVDPGLKFVIMDFIDGHTITRDELHDEAILKSLGHMLAKLHAYKGDFDNHRPQTARARKHYERALKKGVALPSSYSELYDEFMRGGENLNKTDQVLCHGDLNSANILVSKTGEIFIVDWPSATIDNRYTDLGYLTFLNGITDKASRTFLEAYLGRQANQNEKNKLKQAQGRTSFLTSIVWFDFSENEEDKRVSKEIRIKNMDDLLASSKLLTAEDYVKQHIIISPMSKDTKAIRLYALGFLKTYMNQVGGNRLSGLR